MQAASQVEDFAVPSGGLGISIWESHFCRKERVKDGAPSFVTGVGEPMQAWATRHQSPACFQ